MDEITVPLVGQDGSERPGIFQFDWCEDDCSLLLIWDTQELRANARDFFASLRDIRRILELQGLRPKCYGASRSAYPTGMCSEMASGLKVYRHYMGKRRSLDDAVDTFAVGDDIDLATVEQQYQFHEEWIASLRRGGH